MEPKTLSGPMKSYLHALLIIVSLGFLHVAHAQKDVAPRTGTIAYVRGSTEVRLINVSWHRRFDGIWACASLLHVPSGSFPDVASRLVGALRAGGAWYMSFKLGEGERLAGGRLFVDHTGMTLRAALSSLPVDIVDSWQSTDLRPGRQAERWLNAILVNR